MSTRAHVLMCTDMCTHVYDMSTCARVLMSTHLRACTHVYSCRRTCARVLTQCVFDVLVDALARVYSRSECLMRLLMHLRACTLAVRV